MRQGLPGGVPDHLGLGYDVWAPVEEGGKVPNHRRAGWLSELAAVRISADYCRAFARWRSSFQPPGDRTREVVLASRLLVGHGNVSGMDIGLTVHRTWGVAVIPGSALKGLLAHYVDAVYGPEKLDPFPWQQPANARERARYQGLIWRGRRIQRGPGEVYRALLGAPDADDDRTMRDHGIEAGATAGLVAFHDALYVPGSAPEDRPFAVDVLTVHQKAYYDAPGGNSWPNDYDDPNPVAFLTVRPCVRMLVALSGPPDWTELAERLLIDALREWGVGGKTSSGYGRLVPLSEPESERADGVRSPPEAMRPKRQRGDRLTVTRVEDPTGKGRTKFRAADGFLGHFAGEDPPQIGIGETLEVWVANVGPHGYTLTVRPPKEKR